MQTRFQERLKIANFRPPSAAHHGARSQEGAGEKLHRRRGWQAQTIGGTLQFNLIIRTRPVDGWHDIIDDHVMSLLLGKVCGPLFADGC
jgi:hypothetical protein